MLPIQTSDAAAGALVSPFVSPRSSRTLLARLADAAVVACQVLHWTFTFQLVSGIRRRKYARLIERSLLLDPRFYLEQCGDDASARRDPFTHYLTTGARAGLNPNPFFDTRSYLEQNTAAVAGKNPLVHYIRHGSREGRAPSPLFDGAYYLERYPDVPGSGWPSPLAHYLGQGRAEGRRAVRNDEGLVPDLLEWTHQRAGSQALRVLVVDHRMPTPDHDALSARTLAVVRILRECGFTVTFAGDVPSPELEDGRRRLATLGVESLIGPDAVTSHLIAFGHLYGTALLSRPEVARRYMPLVRAHAPWAKVVYDTGDLHRARNARAAAPTGDRAAHDAAVHDRDLELLDIAAADLTLAVTPEERETLLRAMPDARVEVLPLTHDGAPPPFPFDALRERVRRLLEPDVEARPAEASRAPP